MNENTENLYQAILSLKNLNEAQKFFRDLLTKQEILELSQRWQVAQMLNQKISYSIIENKTGLSSTTIARISKCLQGGEGGYKLVLKRLNTHHSLISFSRRN